MSTNRMDPSLRGTKSEWRLLLNCFNALNREAMCIFSLMNWVMNTPLVTLIRSSVVSVTPIPRAWRSFEKANLIWLPQKRDRIIDSWSFSSIHTRSSWGSLHCNLYCASSDRGWLRESCDAGTVRWDSCQVQLRNDSSHMTREDEQTWSHLLSLSDMFHSM